MVSLERMLAAIKVHNANVLRYAAKVRVSSMTVYEVKDKDGDSYRFISANTYGSSEKRTVRMKLWGPRNNSAKAWVQCTCPYFLFHCEMALVGKQSSENCFSNGEAPNITNPTLRPAICKHIVAVINAGAARLKASGPKNILTKEPEDCP